MAQHWRRHRRSHGYGRGAERTGARIGEAGREPAYGGTRADAQRAERQLAYRRTQVLALLHRFARQSFQHLVRIHAISYGGANAAPLMRGNQPFTARRANEQKEKAAPRAASSNFPTSIAI